MKKMAAPKANTIHSKPMPTPFEDAFDEIVELIRAAHRESDLTWLACAEQLFGNQSQDRREIAEAPGGSGSSAD